jgi:hypothetical protein
MTELGPVAEDLLGRLVVAQERIASADERRNELLEQDFRERVKRYDEDKAQRDRVAAKLLGDDVGDVGQDR